MNQMKVSVYGQFNNDTQHVFTYPAIPDTKVLNPATEWLRSIKDPRTIARQFQLNDEAFIMWKAPAGTYYALVFPNKLDNRGGFLQVTLMVGRRVVSSGSILVSVLRQLKALIVDNQSKDPGQVQGILSQLSLNAERTRYVSPVPPRQTTAKPGAPATGATAVPTAYCDFNTQTELETILENVEMQGVSNFSAVWAVKSSSIAHQSTANLVNMPILKLRTYTLTDAKTAFADKHSVKDGDTVTITYKKLGYVDVKQQVVVGPNTKELSIVGRAINLKEADEVGVALKRGITIKVLNATTRQTITSSITVNKKPFESGQQLAINGNKADFTVEAKGYARKDVKLNNSDMEKGSYTVYLTPAMHEITLSVYDEKGDRHAGMVQLPGGDLYKFLSNNKNKIQAGGSSSEDGIMKLIFGLVLGLVLGIGGMALYNSLSDDEEEGTEIVEGDDDGGNGDSETAGDGDVADQAALETADSAYMKGKDIWKEEDIKSEKYKNLYNAFKQSGNEGYNNFISVLGQYTDSQKYNGFLNTIYSRLNALPQQDHSLMMNKISNKCNTDNAVNLKAIKDLIPVLGGAPTQTQPTQQDLQRQPAQTQQQTQQGQQHQPTQTHQTQQTQQGQQHPSTQPSQPTQNFKNVDAGNANG